MKTYWNIDKNLTVLNEWQPNCWIQVTCPTDEDQRLLEEEFKIPDYFLSDISDTDERARYEYDDGWMLRYQLPNNNCSLSGASLFFLSLFISYGFIIPTLFM